MNENKNVMKYGSKLWTCFRCRHALQQDNWSIMANIFKKTVITFELI